MAQVMKAKREENIPVLSGRLVPVQEVGRLFLANTILKFFRP